MPRHNYASNHLYATIMDLSTTFSLKGYNYSIVKVLSHEAFLYSSTFSFKWLLEVVGYVIAIPCSSLALN